MSSIKKVFKINEGRWDRDPEYADYRRQQDKDRPIDFPGEDRFHVSDKYDDMDRKAAQPQAQGGDEWEQAAWDYAQQRYNIPATKLNSSHVLNAMEDARDKGIEPMEFVDGFFGGFGENVDKEVEEARSKNSGPGKLSNEPEKSIAKHDWETAQKKSDRASSKFSRKFGGPDDENQASSKLASMMGFHDASENEYDPARDGTCSYCGEDAYCACADGPSHDDPYTSGIMFDPMYEDPPPGWDSRHERETPDDFGSKDEMTVAKPVTRSLSADKFEQEVWDYAQQRYNIPATKLNSLSPKMFQKAFAQGMEPMEFVDDIFGKREGMFDEGPALDAISRHKKFPIKQDPEQTFWNTAPGETAKKSQSSADKKETMLAPEGNEFRGGHIDDFGTSIPDPGFSDDYFGGEVDPNDVPGRWNNKGSRVSDDDVNVKFPSPTNPVDDPEMYDPGDWGRVYKKRYTPGG